MGTLQLLQVQSETLQRPKPRQTDGHPFQLPPPSPSSHIFWTHPGQPELTLRCEVAQYVGALNFPEGLGKHHPILAVPFPQGFNSPLSLEHHRTPVDWETLGTEPGTLFSGSLGCYPHLLSHTHIKVSFGSGPCRIHSWCQVVTCESQTLSRCSHR